MKEKRIGIIDIALPVLSVVLLLGVKLVFHACEVMEGEGIMACHWAENAIAGVAAVLVCQSVLMLIFPAKEARLWLSVAMLPTAALVIFIPGILINLCMMEEMRCRSVMTPAATLVAAFICFFDICNIFRLRKRS